MRLDFVVPRYGLEVTGGAEYAARMLAERLVSSAGWQVEVITTTAVDAMTWEHHYPAATVDINGVTVHRIRAEAGRDPGFHPYSGRLLTAAGEASMEEADRWIDLQGPLCPGVVEAATSSDAEVVAFYPYLYYPTVRGVPRLGPRSVLHAAAHDEAPIRLPVFPPVFAAAGGLVFHTFGERRLVQHLFGGAEKPQIVLGLGVEPRPGDAGAAQAVGVGDRPYLCCVGRVDEWKGAVALARAFAAYKDRHPGPLTLVYAGQVVESLPERADIVVAGPVDEDVKWGLLAGSLALVSPSAYESFSLVVLEAWAAGVPVLVNRRCEATMEHCRRSGGGLAFGGAVELEAALDRLTGDAPLRALLAGRGRRYVDEHFAWPVLVDRYCRFAQKVAARA
ncbi:MAG TPA: glycosyltransferase family 4 protein [Acidimicrobiales bacterium]|nr:glycosyltransferase family 4 protein [Acidimicrobiales bacterium]